MSYFKYLVVLTFLRCYFSMLFPKHFLHFASQYEVNSIDFKISLLVSTFILISHLFYHFSLLPISKPIFIALMTIPCTTIHRHHLLHMAWIVCVNFGEKKQKAKLKFLDYLHYRWHITNVRWFLFFLHISVR